MSICRVYYVGAGPGDPELITVRGERLLREAQVVIHDAGVAPELLEQCQPSTQIIEARVSPNATTAELQAVAREVIDAARVGSRVVRLKVGDPLFFSRALDELTVITGAGIEVQIIPGVPAPLGASALAGIPLTSDKGSGAVTFISTLHDQNPSALNELLDRNTAAADSICVFCSREQLASVVRTLQQSPRFASARSALISRATHPEQVVLEAPLHELLLACEHTRLDEPFLLHLGDGLAWRPRLAWFEKLPLYGRRLLLCRARHQARDSARAIREHGARPVLLPLIEIEPPSDSTAFDECIARLSKYDWVVLTSANGAEQLMLAVRAQALDARAFANARIAVIGPGTAKALGEWGLVPNLVAREHVAEGLAAELLAAGNTQSVLLVRAEQARDTLPETLRQAGVRVDVVAAYRTRRLGHEQSSRLRQLFELDPVDAVMLTSSSMADALVSALSSDAPQLLSRTVVASIGPITTATLHKLGVRVDVTAEEYTVEGLLVALGRHFQTRRAVVTDSAVC